MPDSVAALSSHDCIGLLKESGPAVWRLTGPQGVQEVEVTGRFHANSVQALLDAALAGLGISLLPSPITASYLREGELTEVVFPGYRTADIGVYVVYLSRRQLPRAVCAFIEFAIKKMVDEWVDLPAPHAQAPETPGSPGLTCPSPIGPKSL
jgi:DNA-binding transcriptional LysR family regulator